MFARIRNSPPASFINRRVDWIIDKVLVKLLNLPKVRTLTKKFRLDHRATVVIIKNNKLLLACILLACLPIPVPGAGAYAAIATIANIRIKHKLKKHSFKQRRSKSCEF